MATLLTALQKSKEVLGVNYRNAVYIRPFNSRRAKEIADDKILTKKVLMRHGIPTAEIFKVIRNTKQLSTVKWEELPKSFALKPNIGTGGSGIIIFYGKKKNALEWIMPNGKTMTWREIRNHISQILDGQFSMGNRKDTAIIEERIVNHPVLKPYAFKGIPDIRVIVFNKVPIMAELRLPTAESDGKANLHAGGIGVGIDIASGITTIAIQRKGTSLISDTYNIIETTPDEKKLPLRGIQIPQWKDILRMAIRCQEASGLGYLGADIALDRNKGPIVFELNARAGLAIQIANLSGMKGRIERVRGITIKNADHGIRVARNLFGGEVEDEIEAISGRDIIGLVEKVMFYPAVSADSTIISATGQAEGTGRAGRKPKKIQKTPGKIQVDTGILRSKISPVTAQRIGYRPALDYFSALGIPDMFEKRADALKYIEDHSTEILAHEHISGAIVSTLKSGFVLRPVIPVTLDISGKPYTIDMIVTSAHDLPYPAILGRRDLKQFLLDTSKTFSLH